MRYRVITFYKYVRLNNLEKLRDDIMSICEKLNLLGRILIAKEGINGAVSGEKTEEFKEEINKFFSDLTFREQEYKKNAYHKLVVRIRKEIVSFGRKVDLRKKGTYLEPDKLKSWITNNKDFVLLDTRNEYETKVGKFKSALILPINNFRDFPEAVNTLDKSKEIVMYCTGGVRCEKSSAFLREQGFQNVYQLKGGIIDYINKYPEDFEGSCFVFDDRLVSQINNPISSCELCGDKCDIYINCHNLDCDKLFNCCTKCQVKMNKACSDSCKNSERQRNDSR